MSRLEVLGIPVPGSLVERWRAWLAPAVQPFFLERGRGVRAIPRDFPAELRDTYRLWKLDREKLGVVWLSEDEFLALPRAERARLVRTQASVGRGAVPSVRAWSDLIDPAVLREQADGHRFVWWPSLLDARNEVLRRFVGTDRLSCGRDRVDRSTWKACAASLPRAKELAGTFPLGSTTNCFGTVLAAAGAADPEDPSILREPTEAFLDSRCRPGGDDTRPGTVLLWRNDDGEVDHAAITIGDGWALEKPSQEWHSPRGVHRVDEVLRNNRHHGWHLSRHRIL